MCVCDSRLLTFLVSRHMTIINFTGITFQSGTYFNLYIAWNPVLKTYHLAFLRILVNTGITQRGAYRIWTLLVRYVTVHGGTNLLIISKMGRSMKNLLLRGFDDGGRAPLSQSACDHGQYNLVETLFKSGECNTFK